MPPLRQDIALTLCGRNLVQPHAITCIIGTSATMKQGAEQPDPSPEDSRGEIGGTTSGPCPHGWWPKGPKENHPGEHEESETWACPAAHQIAEERQPP